MVPATIFLKLVNNHGQRKPYQSQKASLLKQIAPLFMNRTAVLYLNHRPWLSVRRIQVFTS